MVAASQKREGNIMALTLDLSGKVILICGSGSGTGPGGIGSASSELVADTGAAVFAVDYKPELVAETCDAVKAKGATIFGMTADLTDRAQAAQVVPEALKRFGRIDGVINVCGGNHPEQWREIERTPNAMIDDVFALNFGYVFQICRDAAQVMIGANQAGAMVNIASISAHASAPYHALYGAAKAGVISITKTMAVEWKRHNIRVNSVSPGVTKSQRTLRQNSGIAVPDQTYGRRFVGPDEIASAAVFLLSDWARGVTAQNLIVDAGITGDFAAFPDLGLVQSKLHREEA
jgi:NAD(P)-dependent dehydrogenase (short-subunit alcohol dehydrogenase family)